MRGPIARTALLLGFLLAASATAAEEAEGWEPLTLRLEHRAEAGATQCQIHLAHWFEVTLGPARRAAPAELALLVRPASGEVALVNSVGDRMRLERVDCGAEAAARADWAKLSIDALRAAGGAVVLACDGAQGSGCRWLR